MRVAVHIVRYVTVNKAAMDRIAEASANGLCLGCMKPLYGRVVRGLHEKCHKATMRAIERGETTDEERISEGKIAEAAPKGRKPSNPVSVELARR